MAMRVFVSGGGGHGFAGAQGEREFGGEKA